MQHRSTSKHFAFTLKNIHHLNVFKFYFLIKCLLHCVHACAEKNSKKSSCFISVKMRFLKPFVVYQKNAFLKSISKNASLKKHFEVRIKTRF